MPGLARPSKEVAVRKKRYLLAIGLLFAIFGRASAQERMPRGPDLPGQPQDPVPLAMPASFAGETIESAKPVNCDPVPCDSCSPICVKQPRIKVIVPPPEIVYRPCEKKCTGLFHHNRPCCEACPPPCTTCQPQNGMLAFNMNLSIPAGGYQVNPYFAASGFANGGFNGSPFGFGGAGLVPAGFSSAAPSPMEMLMMRAILSRLGNGGDALSSLLGNGSNGTSNSLEARVKAQEDNLGDLRKQIATMDSDIQEVAMPSLEEMKRRIATLNRSLQQLRDRMDGNRQPMP